MAQVCSGASFWVGLCGGVFFGHGGHDGTAPEAVEDRHQRETAPNRCLTEFSLLVGFAIPLLRI